MITSYLIFIFARENMALLVVGLVLFNITFAQLVTVLTLTDAIEYGQLKTGERNEAVVLQGPFQMGSSVISRSLLA